MMTKETTATVKRVSSLLQNFNYRAAQTSRSCRVRNLKTRLDLVKFAVDHAWAYARSDWLFSVHKLENKKLREFLVFQDWAENFLYEEPGTETGQLPSEHLYAWLEIVDPTIEPRTYTEIELLWITALTSWQARGSREPRPETIFSSVGIVTRAALWPAELQATFWDPSQSMDSSWIHSIVTSSEVQQINAKTHGVNTALWVRVVNNCLQLFLPFTP
jgi:hypothetical protein